MESNLKHAFVTFKNVTYLKTCSLTVMPQRKEDNMVCTFLILLNCNFKTHMKKTL